MNLSQGDAIIKLLLVRCKGPYPIREFSPDIVTIELAVELASRNCCPATRPALNNLSINSSLMLDEEM